MEFTAYGKAEYGKEQYAQEMPEEGNGSECIDLLRYLPTYWHTVKEMAAIQKVLGCRLGRFLSTLESAKQQGMISGATWGLSLWERDYGLEAQSGKSVIFRRERLLAKMRGMGTTTKQRLINLASAFAGGEAQVIEFPRESRFVIKFVGVKGVPANMQDLITSIEEIKPAHLAYTFAYTYNSWEMLSPARWADVKSLTWAELRTVDNAVAGKEELA